MSVEYRRDPKEHPGRPIRCAIVSVSDTRTIETDDTGSTVAAVLESVGHEVVERTVVRVDPPRIALVLEHWLSGDADAILLSGETSLGPDRGVVEVVRECLDEELDGFGELFRYLIYQQIGPDAMLCRAVGGIARGKVVFAFPSSRRAARVAMERLILPELPQLVDRFKKSAAEKRE